MNMQIKVKKFLTAEAILRFLITENEELNTIIIYEPSKYELISTDQQVYEALASTKPDDEFSLIKLKKFFEIVLIKSHENLTGEKRTLILDDKVKSIRKTALKSANKGDNYE